MQASRRGVELAKVREELMSTEEEREEQCRTKAKAEASPAAVEVTILDLQAMVAAEKKAAEDWGAYQTRIEDFKKSEEFKQIKLDFRTKSYEDGIGYAMRKIKEHI